MADPGSVSSLSQNTSAVNRNHNGSSREGRKRSWRTVWPHLGSWDEPVWNSHGKQKKWLVGHRVSAASELLEEEDDEG